ncbi:MAG: hypothetical protein U1E56_13985 [Bauldia sp.]
MIANRWGGRVRSALWQMRICQPALAAALSLFAATGAAETLTMPLGGLVIAYDGTEWQAVGAATLRCVSPACGADSTYREGPSVFVRAVPVTVGQDLDCGAAFKDGEADNGFGREIRLRHAANGLDFAISVIPSACRALAPPLVRACTLAGSTTYIFASGFSNGCRTESALPLSALKSLLDGVRPSGGPR